MHGIPKGPEGKLPCCSSQASIYEGVMYARDYQNDGPSAIPYLLYKDDPKIKYSIKVLWA